LSSLKLKMSQLRNVNEFQQRRNGLHDLHGNDMKFLFILMLLMNFPVSTDLQRTSDMRKCDNCSNTSIQMAMDYPQIMKHQSNTKIVHSMSTMSGYPPQVLSCRQPFSNPYHQFNSNGDMQSIMQQTNLNVYKNRCENRCDCRQSRQLVNPQNNASIRSLYNPQQRNFNLEQNSIHKLPQFSQSEADIELSAHQGNDSSGKFNFSPIHVFRLTCNRFFRHSIVLLR
jgi:hypothetical protein